MVNEKRLIDANELLDKLERLVDLCNPRGYVFSAYGIAEEIGNAPTVDAVEVVRCKDCKHGIVDACTNRLLCARCGEIRPNGHVWGGCSTMPENFCSYGERKDNGTV